jgi:hypothetical protein
VSAVDKSAVLGPLTVLSLDGDPVELRSFWAQHPAVLVWVRHFG